MSPNRDECFFVVVQVRADGTRALIQADAVKEHNRLITCLNWAGSGVYAYLRSGSRPSAIASGTIAAALLLSVAFMAGRTRIPATLLALGETSFGFILSSSSKLATSTSCSLRFCFCAILLGSTL